MKQDFRETETQTRLRRAKEALSEAIEYENAARVKNAEAARATKALREKVEELFLKAEREEVSRLKTEYMHSTK